MKAHASVSSRLRRWSKRWCWSGGAVLLLLLLSFAPVAAQGIGTVTGTVRRADNGAGVPGAIVRVVGSTRSALTQSDGAYRLQLPAGRYEIQTAVLGYAAGAEVVTVTAGETTALNFTLEQSAVPVDELVVTGTRGGARTATDSPVPVDVISAAAIQSSGLIETSQILQRLAPSVNFPRTSISDGTDHTRPVTLRGLAPDQVLVLLNGKRRHSTALVHVNGTVGRGSTSVDMNAIPASAIDRIEVLRDGAAAQYGSDAIAGVVNIILKSGERREATTTFGRVHSTEDGRDHRDGQFINLSGTFGALFQQGAYITVNGEYRDRERTNRAYPDARPQYFTDDPRNDDPPVISSWQGDGDATDLAGLINAGLPFGNGLELYGFGGVTRREGMAAGFFRRANDNRTVRAIHPDGFLPEIGSELLDFSGAGGVRGAVGGWRADLSSVYGGNSFRFSVHNSNNVTIGTSSPTEFYAGTMRFHQWTNNLDLARGFEIGLESPVNLGIGAEFRLDRYEIEAGEPDSYRDGGVAVLDGPNTGAQGALGAQVFPGFRPTDERTETRSNVAGYIDLESNLTPQLLLNVAARVERYSDFGSTADGKIAARLEPVRGFAVRGAFGTGFRAPSLAQSWFSATSTNFIVVDGVNTPFDVRTFPVATPEARVLGATSLEPEKSRNYSAGISLEPVSGLSITADYYAIDIDDRIVLSGNFTQAGVRQLLEDNGITGVAGGRFFTNAIDTESRGFDIVASYGLLLGNAGILRFTGGYNQTETEVTRLADPPAPLAALNLTLLDRVEVGRLEEGQPKNNINLTLNYTVGPLAVNLHNQRFGEVTAHNLDAALDQTFDPEWITDVDVSYQLISRLRIAAGANNVFDVYPQEWKDFPLGVAGALTTSGIYRYPGGVSPFGFNGRTVYVKLSYR